MSNIDYAAHGETPARDWAELHRQATNGRVRPPAPVRRAGHRLRTEMSELQAWAAGEPTRTRSQEGFAVDFVTQAGGRVAYLAEAGAWLLWTGNVWRVDKNGAHATELVRDYVRRVQRDDSMRPTDQRMLKDELRRLGSSAGVQALLRLASADPRVAATVDQFDAEREELNTPGGVVDLRTGELSPPDPARLVMRSTTVAPDPSCPTPLFDRFMAETFAGQPEVGDYALDMLALSLLAGQDTQSFVLNYGEPATGKSTIMRIAQAILGNGETGYSVTCDHRMFEKSGADRHATEIAKLAGARMVVTSEIARGKGLDADKFKMLVSGDRLTARFMNKDEFEFEPHYTLWVMSNHKAKAPAEEGAFWRRIKVVRYAHEKPESEWIDGLSTAIIDGEGPGILAGLVDRCASYLEHGMWVPAEVAAETRRHRLENDAVTGWIEDRVSLDSGPSDFEATADLHASFLAWCRLNRFDGLERKAFRDELVDRGYRPKDAAKARGFSGISLGGQAARLF